MKLNLGAGDDRREGYVSYDIRPEVADVVGDVRSLPFPDCSVTDILAFDVLEHLPPVWSLPTLLEWRRVLVDSGRLTLRVPNLFQLARWIVENHCRREAIVNIYGGHKFGPDGEFDHHCAGWCPEDMFNLLDEAGFGSVECDYELNMTFVAVKE